MPNEEAESLNRGKKTAKGCCLAALAVILGFFLLVFTAIACIIIVDTVNLRGEKFTLSKRVERYKVAAQFIWFDFKDWASRRFSEPEIIQCPADPPETEPESELDSEPPESEPPDSEPPDSEQESGPGQ